MMNPMKPLLLAFALTAFAAPAMAFDQTRSTYNALIAKAATGDRVKVPASYRIMTDASRKAAVLEGSNRYYGGEIRTLIIDGRPVRLSERDIIENIRAGHFVPVYAETGTRLSREDWVASLPYWLGQATHDRAE